MTQSLHGAAGTSTSPSSFPEKENFTLKCNQIFSGEWNGRALPWNVNKWLWGGKSLNLSGVMHNLYLPAFMIQ